MIAFVFPGQTAEVPRMGLALAALHPPARLLLEQVSGLLGEDVFRLLKRGGRRLRETEVLQPVITAVALGALDRLQGLGVVPDVVAGHSLGELAAWSATGAISHEQAVGLAAIRGRLMQAQAEAHPGGMLALTGKSEAEVAAILKAHRGLSLATHNAPKDWVLSGPAQAVEAALQETEGRRLEASGAWHSPLMQEALGPFQEALEKLSVSDETEALYVANKTGVLMPQYEIPEALVGQLIHPVLWHQTMNTFVALGVSAIVFVGLERSMRGLAKRNLGVSVSFHLAERPQDIEESARLLSEESKEAM